MSDRYDDLIARQIADRDLKFRATTSLAINEPPEEVARKKRVAEALAVPQGLVNALPDEYTRKAKLKEVDDATADAPVLRNRFADRNFASIAHDDARELGTVEAFANSVRRGQIGLGMTVDALNLSSGKLYLDKFTEAGKAAAAGEGEAAIREKYGPAAYAFTRLPEAERQKQLLALQMQTEASVNESASRLAIGQMRSNKYPHHPDVERMGRAVTIWDKIGIAAANPVDTILADMLPQSLVESAPAVVAAPVVGAAGFLATSGASAYRDAFIGSLQEQGVDVADPQAVRDAVADPAVFRRAHDAAVGYSFSVGVTDAMSVGLGQVVRPFGRAYTDLRTLREGRIETGLEKVGNKAAEALGQGIAGAGGEILGTGEVDIDAFMEFWGEAVGGTFSEGPAVAYGRWHDRRAKAEMELRHREYLDEMSKLVAATKLKERDPQALADLVQDVSEANGQPTTLYVDVADLGKALAQSGMTIQEFADLVPSARESVLEGFLAQTTIELPVGEVMSGVVGSKVEPALARKMRTTTDGFNADEATAFLKQYQDDMAAETERAVSGMAAREDFHTGARTVRERVEGELRQQGYTKEDAAANAALTEAYFTRLAHDWRASDPTATPLTLFERLYGGGPMVVGGSGLAGGLEQPAYHGSPYRFSKFSLEHMGRGEGAQAYGWGLYFAGKREVADWYRSNLTARNIGDRFMVGGKRYNSVKEAKAGGVFTDAEIDMIDDAELQDAISSLGVRDGLKSFYQSATKYGGDKSIADSIVAKIAPDESSTGQLYSVEIPEDDQFLLWDKPLSEQSKAVKKALEALMEEYRTTDPQDADFLQKAFEADGTGAVIYKRLTTTDSFTGGEDGQKRSASMLLNKHGIAGIKYLDGSSRLAGDGSHNYVVFDDNAVEVTGTLYQKQGGYHQGPRGAYVPSTAQLHLLARADASTFAHESAHQFLDLTVRLSFEPDAPAALKKRADDALEWLGINPVPGIATRAEVFAGLSLDEQRPYHEKFAETFEEYLFTGKAPSLEMAAVFRAFKRFMKGVYKTLKRFAAQNKGAELNPEITAIFDRMLATDAQIAEAEHARAVIPLFDAKPESMSIEDWREYQQAQADAHDLSLEYVDTKRLADMKYQRNSAGRVLRELKREIADKRAAMSMKARREVMTRPVYQAWQFLTATVGDEDSLPKVEAPKSDPKAPLDPSRDSLFVAIAKLGGLDWNDVAADGWWDDTGRAPMAGFGLPVLRRKGGLSVEAMAEALAEYGYVDVDANGKHIVEDLADKFVREAGGRKVFSFSYDHAAADRAASEADKPGSTASLLGINAGRLDRASVQELAVRLSQAMAGPDDQTGAAKAVSDALLGKLESHGMMRREGGFHPDVLAEVFGYATGEDMLRDLLLAKTPDVAIAEMTDQMMLAEYGDISSPEAMARAVDEAVMSSARAKVLATEISLIDKAVGSPKALLAAAREAAGRVVDDLKVGSLRPDKYRGALARAGRQAMEAMRAGNHKSAVTARRGQVLNMELAREADKAKADVADFLADIRKWFKNDEKIAKSRDMDMVALARVIVAQYGMVSDKASLVAAEQIAQIKQYDPAKGAELESITAGLPDRKPYAELTVAEFGAVRTVAEAVWNLAGHDKRVQLGDRKVDVAEARAEVIAKLGTGGAVPLNIQRTADDGDRAFRWFRTLGATWRRTESFLDLAGLREMLFQPMSDAITQSRLWRREKVSQYLALLKEHAAQLDDKPISAQLGPMGSPPFVFTKGKIELLHALLHTGNESNKRKLLLGRGWGDLREDGTVNTARWDAFIKKMVDDKVLTKADFDFAQKVWDLMESMKPDAQEAHKRMYGYYFKEVTADAFDTPWGTYRGGYVPAVGDRTNAEVSARVEADDLLHVGNSFMFPTTGKGFTQKRVEYNVALELNLGALVSHIDKVSRFVHIEPQVRDMAKVLFSKDLAAAFDEYAPGSMEEIIKPWLQRAAQQTINVPTGNKHVDRFFDFLNERAGRSMMFANLSNAAQQVTGLLIASVKVPAPAMARALLLTSKHPTAAVERVKALSPWMRTRLDSSSFEMVGHIETLLLGSGAVDKAKRADQFMRQHAYFLQSFVQNRVDVVVWTAAYEDALQRGAADPVVEADSAVRQTQGSFSPEDVSKVEQGSPMWRAMMKFYSYFGMLLNLMYNESAKTVRAKGWVMGSPRLAGIWLVAYGGSAMIAEAISQGLPDDEDDEDGDGVLDEWLAMYFGSTGKTMAAMVPGMGNAAVGVTAAMDSKPYNDRLAVAPAISFAERAVGGAADVLGGKAFDGDLRAKEVRELLSVLGIAGLPTGQLSKTLGYAAEVSSGRVQPKGTSDALAGVVRGR